MAVNPLSDLIDHTADMSWLLRAACGELPLEDLGLFFVEAGKTISPAAVALCRSCEVRAECLDHAYRTQISNGYFGGMSPGKRRSTPLDEARVAIGSRPRP